MAASTRGDKDRARPWARSIRPVEEAADICRGGMAGAARTEDEEGRWAATDGAVCRWAPSPRPRAPAPAWVPEASWVGDADRRRPATGAIILRPTAAGRVPTAPATARPALSPVDPPADRPPTPPVPPWLRESRLPTATARPPGRRRRRGTPATRSLSRRRRCRSWRRRAPPCRTRTASARPSRWTRAPAAPRARPCTRRGPWCATATWTCRAWSACSSRARRTARSCRTRWARPSTARTAPSKPLPLSPPSVDSWLTGRASSYAPPRAGWAEGAARVHTPPLGTIASSPPNPPHAPAHGPRQPSPARSRPGSAKSRHRATASDNYYEDVDPRFTEQPDPPPLRQTAGAPVPTLLLPGGYGASPQPSDHPYPAQSPPPHMGSSPPPQHRHGSPPQPHPRQYLETQRSYDDGSGASDQSGFTSVSQRGVNPQWQPGPADPPSGAYGPGGVPYRNRPPPPPQQQRERDYLLQGNPDFELPANRGGRGPAMGPAARGGRMRAGSASGGGYAAAGSMWGWAWGVAGLWFFSASALAPRALYSSLRMLRRIVCRFVRAPACRLHERFFAKGLFPVVESYGIDSACASPSVMRPLQGLRCRPITPDGMDTESALQQMMRSPAAECVERTEGFVGSVWSMADFGLRGHDPYRGATWIYIFIYSFPELRPTRNAWRVKIARLYLRANNIFVESLPRYSLNIFLYSFYTFLYFPLISLLFPRYSFISRPV